MSRLAPVDNSIVRGVCRGQTNSSGSSTTLSSLACHANILMEISTISPSMARRKGNQWYMTLYTVVDYLED